MGSSQERLNEAATSYLNLLLRSIEARDWQLFDEIGLKKPIAFKSLDLLLATSSEFHGMTLLHAALRQKPPLSVVKGITRICPHSTSRRDSLKRTPLHVAAGAGADSDVIQFLAFSAPETCKAQDEDGRTPLHFACDIDCQLFVGEVIRREPPSFDVVHTLLCVDFSSAGVEDCDDMSPLEYAIFSEADIKVVKLLQRAAQRHVKEINARRRNTTEQSAL